MNAKSGPPRNSKPDSPAIASELNNLLHIISGTSALLENICEEKPGAARYFEMLRQSIARASDLTTDLAQLSESANGNIVYPPAFAQRSPASNSSERSQARVMIVDDEEMLLRLTSEILRGEGYEVVTAKSGFECLDQFRLSARGFDLVLLDLNMPLMDGEETFHRLRASQPDLRVMLCTGYVPPDRLSRMLAAGLCGFVQKPMGTKEYLAGIEAALATAAGKSAAPVDSLSSQ